MNRRHGSALLVVLGALAFILVSGVSFVAWMRMERLPSAVLRRSTADRHLLQAALARAVSEVDASIGDDPWPGLTRGCWEGRVFMPGESAEAAAAPVPASRVAETASCLNLEALGYLPAPLVNDVRLRQRLTWSAKLRDFGEQGAGRYAYVAVNVSDFLDVNRLNPLGVRTGLQRVSPAYLMGAGTADDSEWRAYTNAWTAAKKIQPDWPFVSTLDHALALGSVAPSFAPFVSYVGRNGGTFYEACADSALSAALVADSWFPRAPTAVCADAWLASADMDDVRRALVKDYLDLDDVPTSLALPCAERTPMIVGVDAAPFVFPVKVTVVEDPTEGDGAPGTVQVRRRRYLLDASAARALAVTTVFPFKRQRGDTSSTWRLRGVMRLFFAPEGLGLRTASSALEPAEALWQGGARAVADDRLLTLVAAPCALDDWRDTTVSKQADALPANGVHTLQFPESLEALAAHPLLTVVETTHIDERSVSGAPVFTYEVGFRPWRADLSDVVYKEPLSRLPEGEFALYAACWLRVTDQTGAKVHDAVPAVDPVADVPQALFRFASPKALAYSKLVADTSAQATDAAAVWEPAAFAAVDPRFNWAPEQWYATGAGWDGATWLAAQQALGEDGRDGDIFLNVSNAGHLQSPGEFAFLPRLDGRLTAAEGASPFDAAQYDGRVRTAAADVADAAYMWRSWRLWGTPESPADGVYSWAEDVARDVFVNPHTDNLRLMAGAFANTPYDWWAADTNQASLARAFTEVGQEGALSSAACLALAKKFATAFRAGAQDGKRWQDVWDGWDWTAGGETDPLAAAPAFAAGLHDVDRKFLHAFWRGSFSSRQQLFLYFLRAEAGGREGGSGGTSCARAVALVWRDAEPPTDPSAPHRTRTLFWHRLD